MKTLFSKKNKGYIIPFLFGIILIVVILYGRVYEGATTLQQNNFTSKIILNSDNKYYIKVFNNNNNYTQNKIGGSKGIYTYNTDLGYGPLDNNELATQNTYNLGSTYQFAIIGNNNNVITALSIDKSSVPPLPPTTTSPTPTTTSPTPTTTSPTPTYLIDINNNKQSIYNDINNIAGNFGTITNDINQMNNSNYRNNINDIMNLNNRNKNYIDDINNLSGKIGYDYSMLNK